MPDVIALLFEETFRPWRISLPRDRLLARRPGYIRRGGWLIQYCFGEDAHGDHLDYYATHRLTEDSHERLYRDGQRLYLPSIVGLHVTSTDSDLAATLEREHLRRNRSTAELLIKKGFTKFSINMSLRAGLVAR